MVTLTKAEEKIMKLLWELKKGFIKDIIEKMPDPKPPYNSVSTIVRVLVKKEIVGFNKYGGTYEYYPLISKDEYRKSQLGSLVKGYFNNSLSQVVNFFSENKNLKIDEVNEAIKMLEELKKQQNG
ncbi:BlaI/MecI/CopY family transcriptional regulator [Plebeiibacterium sediminum]|uniref:BlaI/MecI/CopY family transcriptional regulator n=1 Tax=Plebeiibacterium sediminum TaxID=2992112 RepID=A0AAE3M3E5_9BACT|nr:BlaI/MecI/CopY family transcriptional regulator [Plebeiobacterium sediminum]MCW3786506.1 BlaI/MecI/CopY family transcriptional regulator [Plebeiobacterium sediminum]